MSRWKSWLRNAAITLGLLAAATLFNAMLDELSSGATNSHMLYLLAVLLVSSLTDGYVWGILAAVISVPLVNYIFTYPFFSFNLSISGYLVTFITMMAVSIIVSVLTSRIQESERLRAEAEKEKLRANLLRAVSHDLRTPLTSIVGATGAILDNDLPPEKQRELLQDVNTDAQWLLRMIENLLAITRIRGDALPLQMETEVVEEVLGESAVKFHKHFPNVAVDMDLSDDILLADMDAVLIEQVVLNLMENAAYHGQHTTRVRLNTASEGGYVRISVSDNGAGIPREKLPHLFDGELGSASRSADAQKHMGIGLSVCKSIVAAHGGSMSACNNPEGGARFTFTLPQKEDAA